MARIESKKNQLAVIEALWDDPVDLVFVGSVSPYFAPDYARALPPGRRAPRPGERGGRTHFLGWLPKAELPLVYAAAAAHILPSWNELPGLSSLEAGASGTRVISTQYSAIREMLGPDAWTVDPYEPRSIRETTLAALDEPCTRRAYASGCSPSSIGARPRGSTCSSTRESSPRRQRGR